jgi:hypothetical protein
MEIKEIILVIIEIEEIKILIIDLKIDIKRKDLIKTEDIITIIIIKTTEDKIFNIKPVPCY